MRLDSFAYRFLWKAKHLIGLRNTGPVPIFWKSMC